MDIIAAGIVVGLIGGSIFISVAIEAGMKAIAEALKQGKTFNVNLPPMINIRHEDER